MFPGAVADRDDAAYAILGAPLDVSTSFRPGARFGPDRIRQFGGQFDDYDHHTHEHFSELGVYDHGDIGPTADTTEYLDFLDSAISEFDRDDLTPLLLGGEHTVTIAAVRALSPDVFVCADAHLDLRESYAGDPYSHATVTHHALDVAERAVLLGARTGNEHEWERAAGDDVTVVPPEDVSEWTPNFDSERAYFSVDIDAADPGFAPGTGTPEPFGLSPRTLRQVVRAVAPHAVGFDVVEVNDRDDGQAPTLGAKLLRTFVFAHADSE
jgi:agmatinase